MKTMIWTLSMLVMLGLVVACGGATQETSDTPAAKSMFDKEAEAKKNDPMQNKGIGPVTSLVLSETIDDAMAEKGKEIYEAKCTACHKPEEKFIGPAPKDILTRRTPEWVMNMILNPEEMVQKDPIARKLIIEANGAPMANQNLTEEDARAVLEYFRTL